MLSLLANPIIRWVGGGIIAAVIVGGLITWHKLEFVPRAELNQWKQYASDLDNAYKRREKILEKYQQRAEEAETVISEIEKEIGDLLVQESKGDNPVVLGDDDVAKLRGFLESVK